MEIKQIETQAPQASECVCSSNVCVCVCLSASRSAGLPDCWDILLLRCVSVLFCWN
jgi:hypothetical protein